MLLTTLPSGLRQSPAHEPAYTEDGMPKERYRAYHAERAKAGIALAMTAGSASVSRDSPPAFNNLLVYKDEVVPWLKELADAIHEADATLRPQLTDALLENAAPPTGIGLKLGARWRPIRGRWSARGGR